MYVELSDKAKLICSENYQSNCGKCFLRPACVNNKTVRSKEDLSRNITEVNELAEQINV